MKNKKYYSWRNWRELVSKIAPEYSLPDLLILAMIEVESGGDPNAVRGGTDRGLMQLTKIALTDIYLISGNLYKFDDMYDPEINIRAGCEYLSLIRDHYHFLGDEMIVAYNIGVTALRYGINLKVGQQYLDKVKKTKIKIIREI